jgi:hypothetical protein
MREICKSGSAASETIWIRYSHALRIDMTKPKPKDQLQKRGRKSLFREEYILIAKAAARFGAIEEEIADELNIGITTLERWKRENPEFLGALNAGKSFAEDRLERSLYQRANGYSRPAVKIFMTRDGKTIEHHYIEHYPPDPTSMIFFPEKSPSRLLARRAEHRSRGRGVSYQRSAHDRGGVDQGAHVERQAARA